MKKSVFSIILSLCLLLTLIPAVSAEGGHDILLEVSDPMCAISASHTRADAGETVTVTVTFGPGCSLDTLYAVDGNGEQAEGRFLGYEGDTASFEIIMPDDTLHIRANVYRDSAYAVALALDSEVRFGAAAADSTEAVPDDLVTLTLSPAKGCRAISIRVLGESGEVLPLISIGGGIYAFAMPEEAVSVHVVFGPSVSLRGLFRRNHFRPLLCHA